MAELNGAEIRPGIQSATKRSRGQLFLFSLSMPAGDTVFSSVAPGIRVPFVSC